MRINKSSYTDRTQRSKTLYERAEKVLPAGVSYTIRDLMPYPFYVDRAKGSRLYDVDGNEYIDFWMGHGALILGHAPKRIIEAVNAQLERGTHFGYSHTHEIELAELIVDMIPNAEMIRFTNSGTEANMYAIRLARTFTKRTKIAKCEGGWHGGYDSLHKAVHPPFTVPESAGLSLGSMKDTLVIPFNDINGARKMVSSEKPACIVVEPTMTASGFITPDPEFLKGLREICDEVDALLIFDEVVTAFRYGLGGAQEFYDVIPDITIIGKIMGGGFPIGAFCGREDIFEYLNHRKHPQMEKRSAHGGTFTGNPISMVSGIATLRELKEKDVYEHIDRLGKKIRTKLEEIFQDNDFDASVTGIKSTFGVHFQKEKPTNARDLLKNDSRLTQTYYDYMISRGISFMSRSIPHMFIGYAHADSDIDEFLIATKSFVKNHKS